MDIFVEISLKRLLNATYFLKYPVFFVLDAGASDRYSRRITDEKR